MRVVRKNNCCSFNSAPLIGLTVVGETSSRRGLARMACRAETSLPRELFLKIRSPPPPAGDNSESRSLFPRPPPILKSSVRSPRQEKWPLIKAVSLATDDSDSHLISAESESAGSVNLQRFHRGNIEEIPTNPAVTLETFPLCSHQPVRHRLPCSKQDAQSLLA